MLATVKMPTYTGHDFGDRIVNSLAAIVDDPVTALGQSRADVGRPSHAPLDILSASSYPHALTQGYEPHGPRVKRKQPPNAEPQQYYGGIFQKSTSSQDSNETSSAEQEPASRPKKKAKKAKKADDDDLNDESKRQRGRPRLDTQDQTAADRRRTQIRLAQRAYRHRKETTISALKQRVVDLESAIDQMNKTFSNLHDNLIEAGVTTDNASVARQLKTASRDIIRLAKISDMDFNDEATKITEVTGEAKGSHSNRFETGQEYQSRRRPESAPPEDQSDEAEVEDISPLNNSMSYLDSRSWNNMDNDIMSFHVEVPQPQITVESVGAKARATAAHLFPNSNIDYPISSPQGVNGSYTYSFQETSFSRRLHRRSLESAWRNLTNPTIDPNVLNRSFRFTFCFSNRKRMVGRFKQLLQRKAGESLENWNVPYFQIGGAGTHFPRRDKDGSPVYPPNMLSAEKALVSQDMGPHQWLGVGAETPRSDLPDTQSMLESIGYGGEWYDSHDVDEFLKTKGIYLDGQTSFAEVDSRQTMSRLQSLSSSVRSTSSKSTSPSDRVFRTPSPIIPGTHHNMHNTALLSDTGDLYTQQELNPLFASNFNLGSAEFFADLTDKEISSFPPRAQENLTAEQVYDYQTWPWQFPTSYPTNLNNSQNFSLPPNETYSSSLDGGFRGSPKMLTLDVEQFLERVVDGAVCLGRAPGFRKEMVENALAMSVSEGY